MLKLAVKSKLAKKLRLASTALAVVLGVAFLAGTLVFTDTIKRNFDDLFADVYAGTDAYVRSSTTVDLGFGQTARGRIDESLVDLVRSVPGVAAADGFIQGYAQIVGADGKAIGNPGSGPPTLGMNYVGGRQSPWRILPGGRPPGSGEVMLDKHSADVGKFALGDPVTVLTQTGPHPLTLVGVARFGTADSPGGASVAVMDLATTQELMLGGAKQVDAVMVQAAGGATEQQLKASIAGRLPSGAEALTGEEITSEMRGDMDRAFGFFNTFLLVFAAIGLVVACFTIYNTFQIIVTQRTKEMALLRALGATRRQVLTAQLFESVVLGLVASIAGLALGIVTARGLKAMLAAFGIDIPGGGTVLTARTIVVALIVGGVSTAASAVLPSVRASRVKPVAAIRDVAVDTSGQSRRSLLFGGVVFVAGVAAFVWGLSGSGIKAVGLGALLVFLGTFTLGPLIARPASRALGFPLTKVTSITGDLARENAMRNPRRTARTGAALMVGVALVAGITIMAASMKSWTRDVFGEQFSGDFVVNTNAQGFGGLGPPVAKALNQLPEVAAAAGIRIGAAHLVGRDQDTRCIAVDPRTAGRVFDIGMTQGTVSGLTDDGVLVVDSKAKSLGAKVGDTIAFGFLDGSTHNLVIQGIYTRKELAGEFVISQHRHELTGVEQLDFAVYVAKAKGVSDEAARAAIASVSDRYPNAELLSRTEYIDAQAAQLDQIVNLMYGLLGLAVVIALVSIANSMVLSIHERTHELGLLRAVGMTRQQVRSAVSWEAVLIALLGASVGIVLGTFFGWSLSVALRDEGLGAFSMPFSPLIAICVFAVVGAVIASLRPAWHASRLNIMQAISSE